MPVYPTNTQLNKTAKLLIEAGYSDRAVELLAIRMPLRGRDPLELLKSKFRNWPLQRKRISYLDRLWPAFEYVYERVEAIPLRAKLPAFYVDDKKELIEELRDSGLWRELPAAGTRKLFVTKKVQTDRKSFHPRGDLALALLIDKKVVWLFFAHKIALTRLRDPKFKVRPKTITGLFVVPGRSDFIQEGDSSYLWYAGHQDAPYHTVVSIGAPDSSFRHEIELDMDIDEFIKWYDYQYSRGRVGDIQLINVDDLHENDLNKLELWLRQNDIQYRFS